MSCRQRFCVQSCLQLTDTVLITCQGGEGHSPEDGNGSTGLSESVFISLMEAVNSHDSLKTIK